MDFEMPAGSNPDMRSQSEDHLRARARKRKASVINWRIIAMVAKRCFWLLAFLVIVCFAFT